MQTKIILSKVLSNLNELKKQINEFEAVENPELEQSEKLHQCINEANKLVAAYCVLSNHKAVSPQVDIHLKVMSAVNTIQEAQTSVETQAQKLTEPIKEILVTTEEKIAEPKTEPLVAKQDPIKTEPTATTETPINTVLSEKELPKITININDKFRFINELFKTNSNEYNIAIEQLNACKKLEESKTYLNNLHNIYQWNENNEMVKKIHSIIEKRFL